MGNTICRIDEGFYICGVLGLEDVERLHRFKITSILNVADQGLYTRSGNDGRTLQDKLKPFQVKIIGAEDDEDQDLSMYFDQMADFIERGRKRGGVAVHCAAGVSRASTACISYLMLKERLTLDAAFRKVHHVRKEIHPNDGFWKQLRDLEGVLKARGIALRSLREGELDMSKSTGDVSASTGGTSDSPRATADTVMQSLDERANCMDSCPSFYLAARIVLAAGCPVQSAIRLIQEASPPCGIMWRSVEAIDASTVWVRAALVGSRRACGDVDFREALITAVSMQRLQRIDVECPNSLARGSKVIVRNVSGVERTGVLTARNRDDTWSIDFEDGTFDDVEAFQISLCRRLSEESCASNDACQESQSLLSSNRYKR